MILRVARRFGECCPGRRDLVVGISLANLCLLPFWNETLQPGNTWVYLAQSAPTPAVYAAAIAAVVISGLVCAVGLWWIKSSPDVWRRWIGAIVVVVLALASLNGLRAALAVRIPSLQLGGALVLVRKLRHWPLVAALAGLSGLACLTLFWLKARRRLLAAAELVLLALSPFVAVTFGRSLWAMVTFDGSGFSDQHFVPPSRGNGRQLRRVIWIIFDEWDQRLTSETRLQLPHFYAFRTEAISACSAFPPGSDTLRSMSSLIIGRIVTEVRVEGPNRLCLALANGQRSWLGSEPTLFSDVWASGGKAAAVGWQVPYGRLFGKHLARCWWTGVPQRWNAVDGGFWEILQWQFRGMFEGSSVSPFGQPVMLRRYATVYQEILEHGRHAMLDPEIALALVHFSIPHMPRIYDSRKDRLDARLWTPAGYIENLKLVDRTVGALRAAFEQAGLWESTTVLLSSDHWFRDSARLDGKVDHRVPFLLKLAGQKRGITYDKPFNTVLTHDLLLAILRGELTTPEEVVAWLDVHRLTPEGQYRPTP